MNDRTLFTSSAGPITIGTISDALQRIGAGGCDVLFVHSAMTFGTPSTELRRGLVLDALVDVLLQFAPTIVVPTFTFSFCNGQDFDRQQSRSKMGALNEHIRRLDGACRSVDPLMSCAAIGRDLSLVLDLGQDSCGAGSTFDRLHHLGKSAQFLFLGAQAGQCMTYTHYVEERLSVPYRYNRAFTGQIIDGDRHYRDTYNLFVRYDGVIPDPTGRFEEILVESGHLRRVRCGDTTVAAIREPAAYQAVAQRLSEDFDAFLAAPYPRDRRDTRFEVQDMVAL